MKVIQNIELEKVIIKSKGLEKAINDGIQAGAKKSTQEIHATTIGNMFEEVCINIKQWLDDNKIELQP